MFYTDDEEEIDFPEYVYLDNEQTTRLVNLTEDLFNELQEETRMLSHKGLAFTINGIQIQVTVTRDSDELM
jgi:hypothetical protein